MSIAIVIVTGLFKKANIYHDETLIFGPLWTFYGLS